MKRPAKTLIIMLIILAFYGLLCLPVISWPAYSEGPFGIVISVPVLAVYIFHHLGMPGLLEQNGACGWGWCAPTPLGWIFIACFWLMVVGLVASFISRLKNK